MRVAMGAGSNSDYDNYFPIICAIFGIFFTIPFGLAPGMMAQLLPIMTT